MKRRKDIAIFFTVLSIGFLCSYACKRKEGDPGKFKEIYIEQLTGENIPPGVGVRDGKLFLDEGFTLEYSKDSTVALMIDPNKDGSTYTFRCDCSSPLNIGCIPTSEGFITCKSLICIKCVLVLQVHEGFLSNHRFREQ